VSLLAKNDNAVCLMKIKTPATQQSLEKAAHDAWFIAQVQASLDGLAPASQMKKPNT
jgi:hypothetical protein